MNLKFIAAGIAALAIAFAVGRYTTPAIVRIETKTVEVEKKVVDTNKTVHKVTETKENKDGSKTTTVVEDSNTEKKEADSKTEVENSVTVKSRDSRYVLSVLGGYNGFDFTHPIIGGEASTSIIGPIRAGVFGLSNGTYGLSVGLDF